MLDQSILEQVKGIFASLKSEITLNVALAKENEKTAEMRQFIDEFTSVSDRLKAEYNEVEGQELRFGLVRDGQPTGISFRGIPNGHEFTSLLLAVLNADGQGKNFPDETTQRRIKALKGNIALKTYVSLTCTNCPDVVQALNLMSLINPNIRHEMIDGGLFQQEVSDLGIQGVPAVYCNGESLHIGRGDLGILLQKLEDMVGSETDDNAEPVEHHHDVIVVGGGPAGASAAIYSARKGLRVAVVAERIGGQVNDTTGIENLISVPQTNGTQLAADLKAHIGSYQHCDGPFYKGKNVAVIGAGNSGLEAAIDLSGICNSVSVYEFSDHPKADTVLQQKAATLDNLQIFTNSQVTKVEGDGTKLTAITVKDRTNDEERSIGIDGVFVQIGLAANSEPFKEQLDMTPRHEIKVDEFCRTTIAGVYAAGDVTNVPYKQIVIAMGEGAKAALSAFDDRLRGII